MAFTRYKYDKVRVEKQLAEETFTGRYMLNQPGNGINMPFQEDPHIRLQKWGANFSNNAIFIENDLLGLTKRVNRDNICNTYTSTAETPLVNLYPTTKSMVTQSRVETPAWEVRGIQPARETHLFFNPQEHINLEFQNNINTRVIHKDMFKHGLLMNKN